MADGVGQEGLPVTSKVMTTGVKIETWVITPYWIPMLDHGGQFYCILEYIMEMIMARVEYMETKQIFTGSSSCNLQYILSN